MELFIVELARYVIILVFGIYTFYAYRAFASKDRARQNRVFAVQRTLTVLLHTVMSLLLIMENMSLVYIFLQLSSAQKTPFSYRYAFDNIPLIGHTLF